MKKIIKNCVATILVAVVLYSTAAAQGIAMNNKSNASELYAAEENKTTDVSEVNAKILKNFYRSYGEKPGAKWFRTENGFVVSFKSDNIKTNVYYKNTGSVDYKINYYFEEQLPKDVRQLIKSNFYDYSITQVSEVQKDGSTGYFVKIEDKNSIKTIRVINEEWEVVESLVKK